MPDPIHLKTEITVIKMTKTSPAASNRAPGPKGHWLLGSLREFISDTLGFLNRLRSDHGQVARFRLVRGINYLISDPTLIGEVLLHQNDRFIKNRGFWRHYYGIFGRGLLTNEGESWKQHRKLAAPAFQHKRLAHYVDYMVQYTERMLDKWRPGEVRNIHEDMMQITAEIVTRALFNVEFNDKDNGLRDAVHMLETQISVRLGRPFMFLDYLPSPNNIRYWQALRVIEGQVAQFIEQHRRAPGDQRTLLSMLMEARYEDGSPLSNQQLRDETITLFLAGHDTTAITLSWTFYLLSQHPHYWQLLRQEWETVLQGRVPAWDDMALLTLTRGVIRESLRLYPAAYLIGREPLEDFDIGGYRIPKGAGVLVSPYVMGRDANFFPQPEAFFPERWTPEFEKALPRYAFMPFGGGPRTCIGEGFAMTEAMVVLLLIGRRYTLTYADAQPPVPLPSITLPPKFGMNMRCERA